MSTVYNPLKLPEYRKYFKGKKVLVAGAGAVGSALMEFFAKMGVSSDALHRKIQDGIRRNALPPVYSRSSTRAAHPME